MTDWLLLVGYLAVVVGAVGVEWRAAADCAREVREQLLAKSALDAVAEPDADERLGPVALGLLTGGSYRAVEAGTISLVARGTLVLQPEENTGSWARSPSPRLMAEGPAHVRHNMQRRSRRRASGPPGQRRSMGVRYGKEHKPVTRQRIIETAGRRIKRDGIDGSSVATLTKDAGRPTAPSTPTSRPRTSSSPLRSPTNCMHRTRTSSRTRHPVATDSNRSCGGLSTQHRNSPDDGCPSAAPLDELGGEAVAVRQVGRLPLARRPRKTPQVRCRTSKCAECAVSLPSNSMRVRCSSSLRAPAHSCSRALCAWKAVVIACRPASVRPSWTARPS